MTFVKICLDLKWTSLSQDTPGLKMTPTLVLVVEKGF